MVVLNGRKEGDTVQVSQEMVEQCIGQKSLLYDKNGEEHYNLISALHKSMRNSDADAAVYWLARMLEAGEDPLYVARRLVRFADEDVGMADSRAIEIAVAAYQACHFIGMPECTVNLTHAVVYLSMAPKRRPLVCPQPFAKNVSKTPFSFSHFYVKSLYERPIEAFSALFSLCFRIMLTMPLYNLLHPLLHPCLLYTSRCV